MENVNVVFFREYLGEDDMDVLTVDEGKKALEPDFYKPGTVDDAVESMKIGSVVSFNTTGAVYTLKKYKLS